jgi:hypothetical protein
MRLTLLIAQAQKGVSHQCAVRSFRKKREQAASRPENLKATYEFLSSAMPTLMLHEA